MRDVASSTAYALGWLVCAEIALRLTQGADGIAAVWPASGIFAAALLHLGREGRVLTTIGIAVASLTANLSSGVGLVSSLGFTAANLLEGWLVFFLMGGARSGARVLREPTNLLRFAAAAIVAGGFSAVMAGILSLNPDPRFLWSWASTVTLGMLIVTPVILFLAQDPIALRRLLTLRTFWTLLLVGLCTAGAFAQSDYPLLFMPIVAVSVATAILGLSGTSLAILVVVVIGSVLTVSDIGPVSVFVSVVEERVVFFQLYVLSLLMAGMPVALVLALRQRDLKETETIKRLLEAAERAAKVGHWRYDAENRSLYWSREAQRMIGDRKLPENLDETVDLLQPDDRDRVRGLIRQSQSNGIPFAFEARIDDDDGSAPVYIECRGEVEMSADAVASALFGTIMDVSERAEALRQLQLAHRRVEREAAEVRLLAETDHLTGIANRRRILADLADLVLRARSREEILTIALLDIDHFKAINDGYGHDAGDDTLKMVTRLMSSHLAGRERVGRMGGEEFLALFPGSTAGEISVRCSQLGQKLASTALPFDNDARLTVSVGIAELLPDMNDSTLLKNADIALYHAKETGRARCSIYSADSDEAIDA